MTIDQQKATQLFAHACEAGYQPGCSELAWAYANGTGVTRDREKAIRMLDASCAKEMDACARRGVLYLDLDSDPPMPNADAALPLLRQACDAGSMKGCAGLGVTHAMGIGGPENGWFAMARFQQACEGGERAGCLSLAMMYLDGSVGPKQDSERAGEYFEAACELYAAPGCTALGQLYAAGVVGMPNPLGSPNFDAAKEWLSRGCEGGDAEGCDALAKILVSAFAFPPNHKQVIELKQRACRGGFQAGC